MLNATGFSCSVRVGKRAAHLQIIVFLWLGPQSRAGWGPSLAAFLDLKRCSRCQYRPASRSPPISGPVAKRITQPPELGPYPPVHCVTTPCSLHRLEATNTLCRTSKTQAGKSWLTGAGLWASPLRQDTEHGPASGVHVCAACICGLALPGEGVASCPGGWGSRCRGQAASHGSGCPASRLLHLHPPQFLQERPVVTSTPRPTSPG